MQKKDAQSRRAVESGKIATFDGVRTLDRVPDVEQIILLSDEFDLDEIECVGLIQEGKEKTGAVSAAAGAGVYYERRAAAIGCLMTLLITQISKYGSVSDEIFNVVERFNVGLLKESEGSSSVLVRNLCRLIKETTVALRDVSRTTIHVIEQSKQRSRTEIMYNECLELCQCLVYACCIRQRMSPADVSTMIDALHDLLQHDAALKPQHCMVLIAIMLSLLPQEIENDALKEDDDSKLEAVLKDPALVAKLKEFSTCYEASGGCVAHMVDLLNSTMCLYFDQGNTAAAKKAIGALSKGVLSHAKAVFFDSMPPLGGLMEFTVASTVYQMILLLIDVSDGVVEEISPVSWLVKSSKKNAQHEITRGRPGTEEMSEPGFPPDSIATLLSLWSACLNNRYNLFEVSQENVSRFLTAVGTDEQLMMVPSVFMGHMNLLSAISSTENGSKVVFYSMLGKNAMPHASWRKMFGTLRAVVQIYESSARDHRGSDVQQAISSIELSEADTNGLCAFVDVFRHVMNSAPITDGLQWLQELEEDAGVSPCWEVLFEAMCSPVPQKLKASLDRAIASLARYDALVGQLWDRLLGAVVVRKDPLRSNGQTAKPIPVKYDLTYQLNEIEARAEEYEEAIAFVHLLNSLWRNSKVFKDGGVQYEHFTRFVLDEIVSSIYQRSFKIERERWQLISQCLAHCRLCLESLPGFLAEQANSPNQGLSPGEYVLTDLLEARSLFRVVNFTLSLGTDWLNEQFEDGPLAEDKAQAVTESLRLVRCAMMVDEDFIAIMHTKSPGKLYSPFETVLLHDRDRIPTVLDYCRCSWDKELVLEALLVSQQLLLRIPDIVGKLEAAAYNTNEVEIKRKLQEGYSEILRRGNFLPEASQDKCEEQCAQLVLDIILESLCSGVSSNFGQFIFGFEVCAGSDYMSLEDPSHSSSPLMEVLDITTTLTAAASRPQIYEKCLQIVYCLCQNPETNQYFVHYLLSVHGGLGALVPHLLFSPLPIQPASQVSAIYHKAWLLRILSVEIFHADVGSMHIRGVVVSVLKSLFSAQGGFDARLGSNRLFSSLAAMVQDIFLLAPKEPWLGQGVSGSTCKMLDLLDVEPLLGPTLIDSQERAMLVHTWRGDTVIDMECLKDELLQRYSALISKHADLVENLKEAGRHVLEHANNLNVFTEFSAGIHALVAGCQASILATVSEKFDTLVQACDNPHLVLQYLCMAVQDCTQVIEHAFGCSRGRSVENVGVALEMMVSRLRSVMGTISDPNPEIMALISTGLLGKQLDIIWHARQLESMRLQMYNTLSMYLDMCRNSKTLDTDMKELSINILYQGMKSLQPIINDSMSADESVAANALMTLSSLLAYDPTIGVANAIHSSPLPKKVLQDLEGMDPRRLTSSVPSSKSFALLCQSQVDFLLNLTLAGQGQAKSVSVQKMVSLQAIMKLNNCKAFDLRPEKAGLVASSLVQGAGLTRQHLHQLTSPTFRLLLSISSTLSQSENVLKQVHHFMHNHLQLIDRVLKEAGASGSAVGWKAGRLEIEEACLVVQLATVLAVAGGKTPQLQPSIALHESLLDLAYRLFPLNSQSHNQMVHNIEDYRRSSSVDIEAEKGLKALLDLRCALAAYVRTWISFEQPSLASSKGSNAGTNVNALLFSLKDALYQASVFDMPYVLQKLENNQVDKEVGAVMKKQHSCLTRLAEHILASMYTLLVSMGSDIDAVADMDSLKRLCGPAIATLDQLVEKRQLGGDVDSFSVLVRKTKGQLYGQ